MEETFEDYLLSFEKMQEKENIDDRYIYRALRRDELLYNINGELRPPCENCFSSNPDPCCKKTIQQHVNSGSRSREKSKFISCTKQQKIAALWSAVNKHKITGFVVRAADEKTNKSLSSGVIAKIDTQDLKDHIINPLDYLTGKTAINNAKASSEIIFDGNIPAKAVELFVSEHVNKTDYDQFVGTKFEGKTKSNSSKKYVIVYLMKVHHYPPQLLSEMKKVAKEAIESRFVEERRDDKPVTLERSRSYSNDSPKEGKGKKRRTKTKSKSKNKSRMGRTPHKPKKKELEQNPNLKSKELEENPNIKINHV